MLQDVAFGGGVVGGSVWRQGLASRGTILAGNIDKNGGEENGGFSRICRRHGRHRLNEGRKAFLPLDSEMNKEILCNKHAL